MNAEEEKQLLVHAENCLQPEPIIVHDRQYVGVHMFDWSFFLLTHLQCPECKAKVLLEYFDPRLR